MNQPLPTPYPANLESYRQDLILQKEEGCFRQCRLVEPVEDAPMEVMVNGQRVVNFSSNDYLGLACDLRLQTASIEAIQRYGTGSAASRLITGTTKQALSLEQTLAAFKQCEAALVFNSGYQANVAILQAVLQPGDWVFCDRLNHASLIDGCLLSGARWTRYRHLDLAHLAKRLQKAPPTARKWIVTDSVFSMDGDYPDLKALVELAERYQACILVDEAHATGLFGEQRSSGQCEAFGVGQAITLQMGTFSKALGGAGAYVAGSQVMIDTLINRARGFIYSTALPPASLAAAQTAIAIVQKDTTLKEQLWTHVALFQRLLQDANLSQWVPLPLKSAIIPVLLDDNQRTLQISQMLLEAGFLVQAIRPPTVPQGTARLRIALSAAHTKTQIEGLAQALAKSIKALEMHSLYGA